MKPFVSMFLLLGSLWSQTIKPSDEKLVGLWGTEQTNCPMIRGELTIDTRGPEWHAYIAGFDVVVEHSEQRLRFALAGDRGEFRGRVAADGMQIEGQWIQAADQRYASPVRFKELDRGVWRGIVAPLDERITFFLMVERKADGSLAAYIRNPEHNWFGRGTYAVSMTGDKVTFKREGQQIEGHYDAESDSLSLGLVEVHRRSSALDGAARRLWGLSPGWLRLIITSNRSKQTMVGRRVRLLRVV